MPLKPRKLRLSYSDRLRAIVLLRKSKTLRAAAEVLVKRHPGVPVSDIARAYFPKKGPFASARFEGLSRAEVTRLFKEKFQKTAKAHRERMRALNADPVFAAAHRARSRERMRRLNVDSVFARARDARLRRLNVDSVFARARDARLRRLNADPVFAAANRARMKALHANRKFARARDARLRALHADPVFAAANRERGRERLRALHGDPVFAAANRERLKRLNADPVFRKKRLLGLRAYWASIRLGNTIKPKLQLGGGARAGFEGGRLVPVELRSAESFLLSKEMHKVVQGSLAQLSEGQARVVELFFGLGEADALSIKGIAGKLGISVKEVNTRLKQGLNKLHSIKVLRELLD